MYFLKIDGKRLLNLKGNLILTHNVAPVRATHKSAVPKIFGGMFAHIPPAAGFRVRIRATLAALNFIWGQSDPLTVKSSEQVAELKTAPHVKGKAIGTDPAIGPKRSNHADTL